MRAGPCAFLTNGREQEQVEGCADEREGLGLKKKQAIQESRGGKRGCAFQLIEINSF